MYSCLFLLTNVDAKSAAASAAQLCETRRKLGGCLCELARKGRNREDGRKLESRSFTVMNNPVKRRLIPDDTTCPYVPGYLLLCRLGKKRKIKETNICSLCQTKKGHLKSAYRRARTDRLLIRAPDTSRLDVVSLFFKARQQAHPLTGRTFIGRVCAQCVRCIQTTSESTLHLILLLPRCITSFLFNDCTRKQKITSTSRGQSSKRKRAQEMRRWLDNSRRDVQCVQLCEWPISYRSFGLYTNERVRERSEKQISYFFFNCCVERGDVLTRIHQR